MNTFADTLRGIDYIYHREQLKETWGHLAPIKGKVYNGRIVYAVGCFGNDPLNPTPIVCDFESLSSSPWFFEAIQEWIWALPERFRKEGTVMEWTGTFCDYKFNGVIKNLLDKK